MRGQGYDAETKVSVGEFTKAQRQRLEAITAARALLGARTSSIDEWLRVAQFIETGAPQ